MAGFGDHFDARITELETEMKQVRAEASMAFWLGAIAFAFAVILLLVAPWKARAAEPWSRQDVTLEATWAVCHLVDWGTTLDLTHRYDESYHENNLILGEHPSVDEVNLYMGAWMIVHPLITNYLPPKARPIWQLISIGVSGGAAANNLNVGLNLRF